MHYTVRVELHGASYADYQSLHQYMARQGFSRTIQGDDGVVYKLPPAEYVITATLTGNDVLQRARAAAAGTNRSAEIVVATTDAWAWSGLERA